MEKKKNQSGLPCSPPGDLPNPVIKLGSCLNYFFQFTFKYYSVKYFLPRELDRYA